MGYSENRLVEVQGLRRADCLIAPWYTYKIGIGGSIAGTGFFKILRPSLLSFEIFLVELFLSSANNI
jgi:hypothetical protein